MKILNEGEILQCRMYGVRPDVFPEYQTCCEQRDKLASEIKTIESPPQKGIIMPTPLGDVIISVGIGVMAKIVYDELRR